MNNSGGLDYSKGGNSIDKEVIENLIPRADS
jgi:hypothetical protein